MGEVVRPGQLAIIEPHCPIEEWHVRQRLS